MSSSTTDERRPDDGTPNALPVRRGFGNHLFPRGSTLAITVALRKRVLPAVAIVMIGVGLGSSALASGPASPGFGMITSVLGATSAEVQAAPGTNPWRLGGNTGVDGTNFLGTINAAPLIVKTTNVERMRILGTGNVGIGTRAPTSRLHVVTSTGFAILGSHTATTGVDPAIRGETYSTASNTSGVNGTVRTTAPGSFSAGVRGAQFSTTAFSGAGVHGRHSGHGYGVYAEALGTSGTGVYATGGFYGVYSYASQPGSTAGYYSGVGRGVDAYSEATDGRTSSAYGVFGDADAINGGTGVHGRADGASGENYGVRGEVYSTDGYGGYFQNVASGNNGTGLLGLSSGASASASPVGFYAGGVEGIGGNGVIGVTNRASGYGVLGIQGPGAYAGYFSGDVNITGNVLAPSISAKMDHPLAPDTKYLSHSFVESPDMMNVYNGNVILGADGTVEVTLPDWFEALNRDFRYQLTAIGAPGPNLFISEKIKGNRFTIAGGTAGMEVSWMVTGVRQDAYAKAHPIKVEEEKQGAERGKYLNPAEHGRPANEAIGAPQPGGRQNAANRRPAMPAPADPDVKPNPPSPADPDNKPLP